ncbi:cell division protein ZapA [Pseudoalteromonas sp. YIC-827]|uniref:Cell division protein ZapA n=1 Tax=Pseudoalteromonas qingdaonensis TaxID=3131913 RepID=A0ABU9MSU4_9GAMM
MSDKGHSVKVNLLGKEHQFACPKGQEQALLAAAENLNANVEQMRMRSAIRNDDKALLLAALTLSHELLEAKAQLHQLSAQQHALCDKLEAALRQED